MKTSFLKGSTHIYGKRNTSLGSLPNSTLTSLDLMNAGLDVSCTNWGHHVIQNIERVMHTLPRAVAVASRVERCIIVAYIVTGELVTVVQWVDVTLAIAGATCWLSENVRKRDKIDLCCQRISLILTAHLLSLLNLTVTTVYDRPPTLETCRILQKEPRLTQSLD